MPGHPGQALSPDGGPAVTAAAVWLRVSTGYQDSDNQVPDLERFTAHHGYDVAETYTGYGQDKHETHSGPASPCVEAPRRRAWPPEGLPVL